VTGRRKAVDCFPMRSWLITRHIRALLVKAGLTPREADQVIERLRTELTGSELESPQTREAILTSFCDNLVKERIDEFVAEEVKKRESSKYHDILIAMTTGVVSGVVANEATPLVEKTSIFVGRSLRSMVKRLKRYGEQNLLIDTNEPIPEWIINTHVFELEWNRDFALVWNREISSSYRAKLAAIKSVFWENRDKGRDGEKMVFVGTMPVASVFNFGDKLWLTDRRLLALSRFAKPEITLEPVPLRTFGFPIPSAGGVPN
jgi:hypothetical protein